MKNNSNIIKILKKVDYTKIFTEDIYLKRIKLFNNNEKINFNYIYLCIKQTIKNLHNTIFWHPKLLKSFKINSEEPKILFLETFNRSDLLRDTNLLKYYINNLSTINFTINKEKKIKLEVLFYSLLLLLKIRKELELNKTVICLPYKFLHKILFLSELLNLISKLISLYPSIVIHDIVISFQEMSPLENLICQVSNILNIKTIGLCHAIGIEKRIINNDSGESIISAMYSSSVCQYIFCWGGYHKKLFNKYTNSDVRIIGKPFIEKFNSPYDGILFIFDYDINANNKLLRIAEEIIKEGIPISYWFKPTSELSNNFIDRNGPPRKIVLGEKSSLLIALGLQNYKVYVLKNSHLENLLGDDYCVSSASNLIRIYKENKKYDNGVWKNFIVSNDEECVKNFNQEFASIANKNYL